MIGDNFRPVAPEVAAWVLDQHAKRMAIPKRLDMRGRHGKQASLSPEAKARLRQTQRQAFCNRVGITMDQREAYVALIRSTGLSAAEALAVIKAEKAS